MNIHPAIAALRCDLASQRRSQTGMKDTLDAWGGCDAAAAIARDLRRFDKGRPLEELRALHALLSDHDAARAWVDEFCTAFIDALRRDPLGQVPLRHNSADGFARLQLLQSGGAALSLCAYEPAQMNRAPKTVQFADCDMAEMIVSGSVSGIFHSRTLTDVACDTGAVPGAAPIHSRLCHWRAGDQITRRAWAENRHFIEVRQSVVLIQLSRTAHRPRPSSEYRLSDGVLIQQVSGSKRASEQVIALAVLGALGDDRALSPMADFARDPAHDRDARWEAVRQILALDTGRGAALLTIIAEAKGDPLARPAADLKRRLPALYSAASEDA